MRTAWWIATAMAVVGSAIASVILIRRKAIPSAQVVAIAALGYSLVFMALWATASHLIRYPEVEVLRPVKRVLLAMTGGLLAQVIIILDRFVNGRLPRDRVGPLYARGVIGALAGLVGLVIISAPFSSVDQVQDPLAVLCGVAGGGLGASVIELAKKKVFGSDGR